MSTMITPDETPRFLLFRQSGDGDGEMRRPLVRRYTLTRLPPVAEREPYAYLKRTHD